MARMIKEGMDYFPHDTDAACDVKMEAMRALYGNDGYAFYFILLERIYKNNGILDVKNTAIMTAVQRNITSDKELFDKMLATAFEIGLFDRKTFEEKGILTSRTIEKQTDSVNAERARKRAWAEDKKVLDVKKTSERQKLTHKEKVKEKEKVKVKTTPKPPQGNDEAFQTFWNAYPKKVCKAQAVKVFHKINPDTVLLEQILRAIEAQSRTEQWSKDSGQFIPNPAAWLNGRRWEDEVKCKPYEREYEYLC